MTRKIIVLLLFLLWAGPLSAADDLVDPEFKKILRQHGYPSRVYKAEKEIKEEMRARGTSLKAFQAGMGETPTGHLDKQTFRRWQKKKEFEERAGYRQNNPFVENEWGGDRSVAFPLELKEDDIQLILPLDPPENKVLLAWNMKEVPEANEWRLVYGYEGSSRLRDKVLFPVPDIPGFYGAFIHLPSGASVHFGLIKRGLEERKEFPLDLPYRVNYRRLAEEGMVSKELGWAWRDKKCQVIRREGHRIEFMFVGEAAKH